MIKQIIFFLVFMANLLPAQITNQPVDPYKEGFQAFLRKDYPSAVPLFLDELVREPDNFNAYYYLGLSYRNTRQYDNALFTFQRALELPSGSPRFKADIFGEIVLIRIRKGEYRGAVSSGTEALRNGYRTVKILNEIAKAYLYLENYRQCKKVLDASIEMNSSNPFTYNLFSLYYLGQRAYDQALIASLMAVSFRDNVSYFYINLARAHLGLGDPENAAAGFSQALKINPRSKDAAAGLEEVQRILRTSRGGE